MSKHAENMLKKIKVRIENACHKDDTTSSEGHNSMDSQEKADWLIS